MAYDVSTYKNALDHYLTSGVRYLRYTYKHVGRATIYYPFINDAQIKSYIGDNVYKEGRTTSYNNSKPYSDWDWFMENYEIEGLKELNTSIKNDYLVLIVGAKAALVRLTSENYDINRLADKRVYDIQQYLLLNASKRITRSGSHFYRYAYNHGRFEYNNERLSLEQIIKIASSDKNYTSDNAFIDYVSQVQVDKVDDLLQILLDRYIRGNRGTDKDVSKQVWLVHAKLLFGGLTIDNEHHEEVRKEIVSFCENTLLEMERCSLPIISTYYHHIIDSYNKSDFMTKLYHALIKYKYLNPSTPLNDFLYFFCHKYHQGVAPTSKLKWEGSNILLATLIGRLSDSEKAEWKNTESIFEGAKAASLKSQYGRDVSDTNKNIIKSIIDECIPKS